MTEKTFRSLTFRKMVEQYDEQNEPEFMLFGVRVGDMNLNELRASLRYVGGKLVKRSMPFDWKHDDPPRSP